MDRRSMHLVLLLLFLTNGCLSAQQQASDTVRIATIIRESQTAAAEGLATLKQLSRDNYRTMGFGSSADAARATLGEPLAVFYVRLDSLRAYTPQSNVSSLLNGGDQVMYPVLVDGRETSSIQLARAEGSWRPTTYGAARIASTVAAQRTTLAAQQRLDAKSFFAVRVPALNLYFIGWRSGNSLMLAPAFDDSKGRWKAGTAIRAQDVFRQLVEDARAYNGLPS